MSRTGRPDSDETLSVFFGMSGDGAGVGLADASVVLAGCWVASEGCPGLCAMVAHVHTAISVLTSAVRNNANLPLLVPVVPLSLLEMNDYFDVQLSSLRCKPAHPNASSSRYTADPYNTGQDAVHTRD
jgi:hypothetical protein